MGTIVIEGGDRLSREGIVPNGTTTVESDAAIDATLRLDPSDLVVAGLVDVHCHVGAGTLLAGPRSGVARYPFGVSQSECLHSGVVACADAGSFGTENVLDAAAEWAKDPAVEVRAWVFPYGEGIHDPRPIPDETEMVAGLRAVLERAPSTVVGVKIRLGRADAREDRRLLDRALSAAGELGLPIMVHLTGSHLEAGEVCAALRPGDVLTHAFHGRRGGLLDGSGALVRAAGAAQRRGVVFDVAPGAHHFSWRVLEAALEAGVAPDTVSTDLTYLTWRSQPVCVLPNVVSLVAAGGLGLERTLLGATYRAADVLGVDLDAREGVVVLRRDDGLFALRDSEGEERPATTVLRVVAVVGHASPALVAR